jgi:putative ABC transport system permease protein
MSLLIAWRLLLDDALRTALAIVGVFLAIVLVFFELGLFSAVPRGGLLLYDHLHFDLMLASSQYQYQTDPGTFPLSRLDQAKSDPSVASVTPLYLAGTKWQSGVDGKWPDVFLIGFSTANSPFMVGDINRQLEILRRPDTVLVDDATRKMFGPLTVGRIIGMEGRRETIGGTYRLGTGFMGLGVVLLDQQNFERLFPLRGLGFVNLAPIVLKPGAHPDQAARALQIMLPSDIRVFTRKQLATHEVAYWTTRAAVGLIFGSGLVIAIVVGIMIIYAILATQISRHLPQFATLKAIGYADHSLYATIVAMVGMIVATSLVPAFLVALWLYSVIRRVTMLPAEMTGTRFAAVLAASLVIALISAVLAMAGLRRADPADVF